MFRSARIDGFMAGIVIFRSFQVLFVSGLPGEVPAYSLVHTLFFLFTPALSAVRFRFCYWGRDCAKEAPFCMACVPSSIACAITDRRILFLPADPGMCFFGWVLCRWSPVTARVFFMGLRPGFCSRFLAFPAFFDPCYPAVWVSGVSLHIPLPAHLFAVPACRCSRSLRVAFFRGFMRFPAACEMFCVQGNHILFRWSSWGVSHLGTWESPPFQSTGNGFS